MVLTKKKHNVLVDELLPPLKFLFKLLAVVTTFQDLGDHMKLTFLIGYVLESGRIIIL